MALILQLETATTSCSVALALNGEILAFKELEERNIHASHITLFIGDVLKEAGKDIKELEAVAVSMGPGSYTGLRIGVSTAKGLCFALDIPLIAVNTLQAMAYGIKALKQFDDKVLYCPMIDARRMEVFTAVYDYDLNEISPVEAKILDGSSFAELLHDKEMLFFGDGAFKCQDVLQGNNVMIYTGFVNSAQDMTALAFQKFKGKDFVDVAYFEPFYLKDFLITKPKAL